MTDKRITKRDRFAQLRVVVSKAAAQGIITADEHDDLAGFIKHEDELLSKKHSAKSGPTKTQLANESTKTAIVGVLAVNGPTRATELANALDISVQKCTALLRQLVTEGRVLRNEDKKVVTFSVSE